MKGAAPAGTPEHGARSHAKTPFDESFDITHRVILDRARRYRNLVVCVALTGLVLPIAALVTWSALPLLGLLALFPLFGLFLFLDQRDLGQWQHRMLDLWLYRGLRMDAYCQAILSHPRLPAQTLDAMLDALPRRIVSVDGAEGRATDGAIALLLRGMHEHRSANVAVVLSAQLIASVAIAIAVVRASAIPLIGLLLIPGIAAVMRFREHNRVRASRRAIAELFRGQSSLSSLAAAAAQLDWSGVGKSARERWLARY